MTSTELQLLIDQHSDDSQAEVEGGHVYQVWQDGEVTLQKCGSLLGQRNLHMIYPGFAGFDAGCVWPHKQGNNKFIYTTESGAKAIHRAIASMTGGYSYCGPSDMRQAMNEACPASGEQD